jgi:GAF domain-containing protein/two-component sensor histidine kinase
MVLLTLPTGLISDCLGRARKAGTRLRALQLWSRLRRFPAITRQVHELRALVDASRIISSALDHDELLEALYQQIKLVVPADFYLIALFDPQTNVVSIEINVDEGIAYPKDRYPLDKGLLERVIHSGEPLRFESLEEERGNLNLDIVPSGSAKVSHGWLGVPMHYGGKVVGAIVVASYRRGAFDAGHQQILTSVANQAAVALENARLYAEAQRRAEEQAVLNELGQALTARLNVEQVIDEAYRGASRLLDTTNFYVALYNPEKDQVTFALDVREGALRKPYSTRQAGQGLTEYVLRNRAALLIQDDVMERLASLGVTPIGQICLSWLGVPLMIGERVLGVIAVQSYTAPHAFSEHDRDLLTAIASQAAIALQNALLFQETSSRAERLAVVNRIASAASTTLDLQDLMETVYRELVPAFNADAFFIALYDEPAQEVEFCFRVDQGVREPPERVPLGVGLTSVVITERKPLVIRDEQERAGLLSSHLFGTMKRAASWLGAPMLVGQRVIGVISVQSYQPNVWDEEDELLLLTIADQVAVALENARLFAEIAQRMQELESLYHADEELYRHLDLDQLLETLVDVAIKILQADKGSVMVWDARRERLAVHAARGFQPDSLARMSFAPGEGAVGLVGTTGEPIFVEDTGKDSRVIREIVEAEGIRSFMHVPIKIEGRLFGVFNVDYLRPRRFMEYEQRLFAALAQRAALAIENAQLYEQAQQLAVVQERQRLARDLHDAVTQTLFSASLIAEVLPALWEKNEVIAREYLQELRQLSRGALAEMRTLLLELRPAALLEARIEDLLRQLGEAVTGQTGAAVTVSAEGQFGLPQEVHVALYRIAQEALNNVVKHAHARAVSVSLRWDAPIESLPAGDSHSLELCVRDDGNGFDLKSVPPDHLGLSIMRERAQAIGARLEVTSQPAQGTEVRIVWPGSEPSRPPADAA